MSDLGYETFLLYEGGSLPKFVPRDTKIASKYFINLLFSSQRDAAALWPVERFDPYVREPDRAPAKDDE